jgi:hypothetical protein
MPMFSLPAELDKLCFLLFVQCDEFENTRNLRAVFVTAELAPFANGLPERTDSKRNFVNAVKLFLLEKRLADGRVLLLPFLNTLLGHYPEQDALHGELSDLYQQILALPGAGGPARQSRTSAQPPANPSSPDTAVRLLGVLDTYFDLSDLKNLCFEMGIDFDNLEGGAKRGKAQALIQYCQKHNRFSELVQRVQKARPHAAL